MVMNVQIFAAVVKHERVSVNQGYSELARPSSTSFYLTPGQVCKYPTGMTKMSLVSKAGEDSLGRPQPQEFMLLKDVRGGSHDSDSGCPLSPGPP